MTSLGRHRHHRGFRRGPVFVSSGAWEPGWPAYAPILAVPDPAEVAHKKAAAEQVEKKLARAEKTARTARWIAVAAVVLAAFGLGRVSR